MQVGDIMLEGKHYNNTLQLLILILACIDKNGGKRCNIIIYETPLAWN